METSPLISPRSSTGSDALLEKKMYSDLKMNEFISSFKKLKTKMNQKLDLIENIDLTISILSYKIFESTHLFKDKISALREERDSLLTSVENRSEVSLVLNDLEIKLQDLQRESEEKNADYKSQKIIQQEEIEATLASLENDFKLLKELYETMRSLTNVKPETPYRPQTILITQQYVDTIEDFENDVDGFEKLQETGWKLHSQDEKLSALLTNEGLMFNSEGQLLTKTGSCISFQEAEARGYFHDVKSKILQIRETLMAKATEVEEKLQEQPLGGSTVFSEPTSSVASSISSEEVKYLKSTVGKALTLALAEITTKQPKDPIHYLGHYLFKYRYNQELEHIQKDDVDALTKQRRFLAEERWHKFVEEEARNAVIDMVLRAEQMALERELKRIEMEQMMGEEEQDNYENLREQMLLQEEARDKFE